MVGKKSEEECFGTCEKYMKFKLQCPKIKVEPHLFVYVLSLAAAMISWPS